jgi:hypothetical protein
MVRAALPSVWHRPAFLCSSSDGDNHSYAISVHNYCAAQYMHTITLLREDHSSRYDHANKAGRAHTMLMWPLLSTAARRTTEIACSLNGHSQNRPEPFDWIAPDTTNSKGISPRTNHRPRLQLSTSTMASISTGTFSCHPPTTPSAYQRRGEVTAYHRQDSSIVLAPWTTADLRDSCFPYAISSSAA